MTTAWDLFLAHLTPGSVESERFAMPSLDERPGSAADRRMRREHAARAAEFWHRQKFPSAPRAEIAAAVIEKATTKTYQRDPVRFRALVEQMNNNKKAA